MSTQKQAEKHDRLPLWMELKRRGWTVSKLANKLGRPRPTVSTSLNHGRFPEVLADIRKELGHGN